MIRPPGLRGAVFGDASAGDTRADAVARSEFADRLGIPHEWAWLRQVHGADVVRVTAPGDQGDADAAFTSIPMLPLALSTADCFPVILEAESAVGVAHAGWRGTAVGVVSALRDAMEAAGAAPDRAAIGPGIGRCCFEVGPEVTERFPGHRSETEWGTPSVDLAAAIAAQLAGIDTWVATECTMEDSRYHSHRRDGTPRRQVTLAWLPA